MSDIVEDGPAEGEALDAGMNLRDALSQCLWTGRDDAPVIRDGSVIGRVTIDAIRARAEGRQ